jgi:hypothetical protein
MTPLLPIFQRLAHRLLYSVLKHCRAISQHVIEESEIFILISTFDSHVCVGETQCGDTVTGQDVNVKQQVILIS